MKDRQGKTKHHLNEIDQKDFHIHPFEALTAATLPEVTITLRSVDTCVASTSSASKTIVQALKPSTSSTQLRFP